MTTPDMTTPDPTISPASGSTAGAPSGGSAWTAFRASVRADHFAMRSTRDRYPTPGQSMKSSGLLGDGVQKIGFQLLIATRFMRLVRTLGIPLGAQLVSRAIRHAYAAEIHWDAELADGISLVHANGLVISHGSVVGPGCVLFQNVTLGESIDPVTRVVGSPTLESDVHVGPGAVLLGPITVGQGSKIMANVVLDRSVPAGSVVRGATPTVVERSSKEKFATSVVSDASCPMADDVINAKVAIDDFESGNEVQRVDGTEVSA